MPGVNGMKVIADFLAVLSKRNQGETYYRGHADGMWKVIPSAFRPKVTGITNITRLNGWRRVSSRFANPRPQNDLEWLVLAQHYGVPTTLLDWTTNPLIALFFATERSGNKQAPGAVLAYDASHFQKLTDPGRTKPFLENRKKPALLDTSAMNPRTLAQDSAMSVHCVGCEEMAIESENAIFQIPSESKYRVRVALKHFGLSADRLYSDINIAAREYAEDLEWEA